MLSFFLLLVSCANDGIYGVQEVDNELQNHIDDLETILSDLEREIEGKGIAIADLESEIEVMEEVISSLENEVLSMQPYRHGWQNTVVQSMIADFESLNLEEFLGGNLAALMVDDIALIAGNNVIATVGWEDNHGSIGVVLSFRRVDEYVNWDYAILSWEVIGYTTGDGLRLIENRRRNTDRLTDLETVMVHFYYYDRTLLQHLGIDEGLYYVEEEIAGIALREEFIRLISNHTDIEIWDLWYEDDILYVDLMPVEKTKFSGQCGSSTHAVIIHRHNMLIRTLLSFSDAQTIRVLIGGERDAMLGEDRPIGGTFNVVENRWE